MITEADSAEAVKKFQRPLREVGKLVDQRIKPLQSGYLAGTSTAQANMAELRRSVALSPGENPRIWQLTEYPVHPGTSDNPTREEWAVHLAMTLYAIHQQSRSQPAYQRGDNFSQAVNRLAKATDREDTIWMRFTAILTSPSIHGIREHMQSIIGQLHSNSSFISVDYAALADDLNALQNPRLANSIRLKWERDYYRAIPTTTKDS